MTQLSKNFTLEELTSSATALARGISNEPGKQDIVNLTYLAIYILQPLRDFFKIPIFITSGFRSPALNKAVGGVNNSFHLQGRAADIRVKDISQARDFANFIVKLPFLDKALIENPKDKRPWLHVQWSASPHHTISEIK